MIKHLVLEGGSYKGLSVIGTLKYLNQNKYYNIEDIKTIYGTSAGAYIAVLICLNIEWKVLIDYIVNRPWEKIIPINAEMFIEMINSKGFFDDTFFYRSLENVFLAKDITLDITLKEFYDFSQIELHMFSIRVQDFVIVDYSYKTHPKMKLLHVIYQTCCIPYIFKPHWYDNNYYIDGGLLNNYPVKDCIQNGAKNEEILGICFHNKSTITINQESNIFEFCYYIHKRLAKIVANKNKCILVNELQIPYEGNNINTFLDIIKNKEIRELYIKNGEELGQRFLDNLQKNET